MNMLVGVLVEVIKTVSEIEREQLLSGARSFGDQKRSGRIRQLLASWRRMRHFVVGIRCE